MVRKLVVPLPCNRNKYDAKVQHFQEKRKTILSIVMSILEIYNDISKKRWLSSIGKDVGVSRETVRRLLKGKYENDWLLVRIIEQYKLRTNRIKNTLN